MSNLLRLEKGPETECRAEDIELIRGIEYKKRELSDWEKDIVRYLHAMASKYILTHRPLDKVALPHDTLEIPNMEHTILRPEIAMTVNGHDFPEWIVEFVDPEQDEISYLVKANIYKHAGVQEYWVVDAEKKMLTSYVFEKGGWIPNCYDSPQRIKVSIYKELYFSYSDIFAKKEDAQ
ncbi:MAG: Uma2 family endonuclease [Eubacterium sp.]|nr:Uma2 family endonuclease [Eubacterium sp.]